MNGNNIFKFATKELSQDAFLAWLVNWIGIKQEDENRDIKECAQKFLIEILKNKEEWKTYVENNQIEAPKIEMQFFNIDVLILLKKKKEEKYLAIIIEDKVNTSEHDAQIEYYKYHLHENLANRDVKIEKENLEILTVYYKPYDECNIEEKNVDCVWSRENIIELFAPYEKKIKQQYFTQYCEYIKAIENCAKGEMSEEEKNMIGKRKEDIEYLAFFKSLQRRYQEYVDDKINSKNNKWETVSYYGESNENKEANQEIKYTYQEEEKVHFGIATRGNEKTWWCNLPVNFQISSDMLNSYAFLKINFCPNEEDTIMLRLAKRKKAVDNEADYIKAKEKFPNEKIVYFCEYQKTGQKYKYNLYHTFDTTLFKGKAKEDVYQKIDEKMIKTKLYCKEQGLKIKPSKDGGTKQQPEINIFTIHLPKHVENKKNVIQELMKNIIEDLDGKKMEIYIEEQGLKGKYLY